MGQKSRPHGEQTRLGNNNLGKANNLNGNNELATDGTSATVSSNGHGTAHGDQKRFKQPEKVSFLEHNRLRNMAISLRKLSVPTDLLVSSINRLDIDQLSLDSIEILMRMIPNAQEVKAYQEYESSGKPLSALTDEDKFLCHMSKVDRLEQKIKIMFYMKNLEVSGGGPQAGNQNTVSSSHSYSSSNTDSGDLLAATKAKIECVESASRSLRESEGIRILLEYILVFGNYLNSSSRSLASAPAYGFKLQALDMVSEAKSTQDKSRNLLHFIVDTILKNLNAKEKAKMAPSMQADGKTNNNRGSPSLGFAAKKISPLGGGGAGALDLDSIKMPYDFDSLMSELEQAANVSLETLMMEVKEFERGIEMCIKELHVRCAAAEALELATSTASGNNDHRPVSPNPLKSPMDETIVRLQKFIKSRSCDIIEIRDAIQRAQKEFNESAQYFGENTRTIESSSLFSIFLRHLKNFKQCQIDNKLAEKRKFDEELRKQIQEQQAMRAKKKLAASMEAATATGAMNNNNISTNQANGTTSNGELANSTTATGEPNSDGRLLNKKEVSHGTLDNLISGLKVEPYRRVDGSRKSIRRTRGN